METITQYDDQQLHIFFLPLMVKSHMMPTIDMAKLFASRGWKATIVTTPYHANLLSKTQLSYACNSQQEQIINVISFKPLYVEGGLPEGWEWLPMDTRYDLLPKAGTTLAPQLDQLLQQHHPDCLLADMFFPWATDLAARHGIPTLTFNATCCFSLCVSLALDRYKPHQKNNVSSDSDPFLVPNLPGDIKFTRNQLPYFVRKDNDDESDDEYAKFFKEIKRVEERSYGYVSNSFYELEGVYADHFKKEKPMKIWQIGPLFLCNKLMAAADQDKAKKGKIDAHQYCFNWLNSKRPYSVVYLCFGSLSNFSDAQLMEIALGLEASGQQFIWVVTNKLEKKADEADRDHDQEEWLPQGFEKRMEGKGLIFRGWAPQVEILEHKAVGGFLTHCGWNSILEGVYAGLPMATWPVAADHFYVEQLVTQVLGIGIPVGAQIWAPVVGDFVRRESIEKAVSRIMVGEKAQQMRSKAMALGDMAKVAVKEGGSSYSNLDALIDELKMYKFSR